VASSGEDGQVKLWDCRSGRLLGSYEAGATPARWLASCSGGAVLLAACGDRRVAALNVPSPAPAGALDAAELAPALASPWVALPEQLGSRVKSFAFDAAGTRAAVVLFDSTLSVLDLASGQCLAQLIKRGEPARGALPLPLPLHRTCTRTRSVLVLAQSARVARGGAT
jgi:WD40 repeat protein